MAGGGHKTFPVWLLGCSWYPANARSVTFRATLFQGAAIILHPSLLRQH